ncbi:MAG TPA: hypothetical protein VG318_14405 [Actinomycetota bacterium]|nr:hypothetical protein [Actinomycetota bacterium]
MPVRRRSAYSDAVAWIESRRPDRRGRAAIATRALTASLIGALLLLCLVGMLSPARFGSQGSRAFGSGWRDLVLAAVAGGCAVWIVARRRSLTWLVARAREPFGRPLEDDPAFAGASGALAATRGPLRTRFALGWIWLPAGAAVAGAASCLAAAYFVVDAVLARFEVGWQQPIFAALYLAIGWAAFRAAAGRLAVWPLSVSAHRAATTGYP